MTTDAALTAQDDEDILICEYEKRPKGAPSFFDLHDAITAVVPEPGALRVQFDPAPRAAVEELAAAERLCCPTIDLEVSSAQELTLTIRATPGKLMTLERMLTMELE
jgi:hypothetical protein